MKYVIFLIICLLGCTKDIKSIDIFYSPGILPNIQVILIVDVNEYLLTDDVKSRYNAEVWNFYLCTQ